MVMSAGSRTSSCFSSAMWDFGCFEAGLVDLKKASMSHKTVSGREEEKE